jgi:hypothetical protein
MRFILRMTFWLGLVLAILPSAGSQPTPTLQVSTSDAMSAARATMADMRQFCERQHDACSVGTQAAVAIGHRVQAGAKMLYEFLNDQLGPGEAGNGAAPTETGSVSASAAVKSIPVPAARPSQNNLTPADFAPAWRGPQPRREPPA